MKILTLTCNDTNPSTRTNRSTRIITMLKKPKGQP